MAIMVTGAHAQDATDASKQAVDAGVAEVEAPSEPAADETSVEELPEELEPALTMKVEPEDDLHVGDSITVTLTAEAPKGTRISVPKRDLAPFELLDRNARVEPAKGGNERHVFRLTLMTFEPEATELPALELRVITPDQRIGSVFTQARPLDVRSLIENEPEAEPKPATAPVAVMEDDYTLAWAFAGVLGALLMAALGFWGARWYRRRPRPEPPEPPPRPPWEQALDDLHRLRAQRDTWLSEGRAAEYVDGISDVVREYLGSRYGFDGLESTTDEIVSMLSTRRPRELPLTDVVTLLQECDLVKFAKASPEADLCDTLHAQATQMVQRSRPTLGPDSDSPAPVGTDPSQPGPADPDPNRESW